MAKKKPPAAEPVKITADDVRRFHLLDERRKQLSREADNLEREARPLKEKLLAYVREKSKSGARSIVAFQHLLELVTRAGRVKWKDAFVERCGTEAALELERAVPPTESLSVKSLT